jgi:hypothetical protein
MILFTSIEREREREREREKEREREREAVVFNNIKWISLLPDISMLATLLQWGR